MNHTIAYSFHISAYRDYIGARLLINNNLILQGITLASTAIEKYIKVVLAIHGKKVNVHLNKLDKIKTHLNECNYDVTKIMDERFLEILGEVYTMRYYDDIKTTTTIGFFINQFLGELDSVVNFFEEKIFVNIIDINSNLMSTPYKKAAAMKDSILVHNNYIFNGMSKREFMEMPDTGYALKIRPDTLAIGEIDIVGSNIINKYESGMTGIRIAITLSEIQEIINTNFDDSEIFIDYEVMKSNANLHSLSHKKFNEIIKVLKENIAFFKDELDYPLQLIDLFNFYIDAKLFVPENNWRGSAHRHTITR